MAVGSAPHQMVCEAETAAEVLFTCLDQACGRQVVVGKTEASLTVVRRGDFRARHVGSVGGLVMGEPSVA